MPILYSLVEYISKYCLRVEGFLLSTLYTLNIQINYDHFDWGEGVYRNIGQTSLSTERITLTLVTNLRERQGGSWASLVLVQDPSPPPIYLVSTSHNSGASASFSFSSSFSVCLEAWWAEASRITSLQPHPEKGTLSNC